MTSSRIALIPEGHSKPVGRYSPGIRLTGGAAGSLVFVSGQVASDSTGTVLHHEDAGAQADVVFDRIEAVLAEADLGLSDLVSLCIYVVDLRSNFGPVSTVRNRRLSEPGPASAFVGVSELVERGCLLEISAIAAGTGTPA
ncbi:MAG: RidA family protein [Jatrophihabitans sp.]